MASQRIMQQREFAAEVIRNGGNATKAAQAVFTPKNYKTANVKGTRMMQKPLVREMIEGYAHAAAQRVKDLSEQDDNLTVALGASKDILDRAGYKPIESQTTTNIAIFMPTEVLEKHVLVESTR